MERNNFVSRVPNSTFHMDVAHDQIVVSEFSKLIKDKIDEYNIPSDLIINFDETACSFDYLLKKIIA